MVVEPSPIACQRIGLASKYSRITRKLWYCQNCRACSYTCQDLQS